MDYEGVVAAQNSGVCGTWNFVPVRMFPFGVGLLRQPDFPSASDRKVPSHPFWKIPKECFHSHLPEGF